MSIAGLGLAGLIAGFFTPLAEYTIGNGGDSIVFGYFGAASDQRSDVSLSQEMSMGVPLLVLAVATGLATADRPRWRVFARLAVIGLGAVVAAGEFARVYLWRDSVATMIDEFRSDQARGKTIMTEGSTNDLGVEFEFGLWLLLGGLVLLTVSVLFVPRRTATGEATTDPPTAATPDEDSTADEPADLTVHDDPPLSIYKKHPR